MWERGRWIIVACVVIMTIGQILFKQVAVNYNKAGSVWDWGVLGLLVVAGTLYVLSTGLWVIALRFVDISKAYPYFALGFVLVPLVGAWMFGETLNWRYGLGVMFIVTGVVLTSST